MLYLLTRTRSPRAWLATAAFITAMAAGPLVDAVQVYVQDSPAAADLIAAAEDRAAKQELDEAARLVQQILDEHGAKLLKIGDNRYAEAHHIAQRLVGRNDELLAVYRQLYEPLARRMLEQAVRNQSALLGVVQQYGLTDAGLDAAMQLAGLNLEAGQADEAAILLDELAQHPALDRRGTEWATLVATAALLQDDEVRYQRVRADLKSSNARDALKSLDHLEQVLEYRPARPPMSGLDTLPAAKPPELIETPVWSRPIGGAEQYLIDTYNAERQQVDSLADDGRYLNIVPTVAGGVMYVNNGSTVHAIEPSSGLEIWRQDISEPGGREGGEFVQAYNRWLPYGADLNLVDVADRKVVAVGGYSAMVTVYPYHRNPPDSSVACLDAQTGKLLWRMTPEQVHEDLADGFWYGRPIVSQGRVYVLLRLRQRTQFTDAWLIALDLQTGKPVWSRHLASTEAANRQSVPGLAHMALADGWLYVDSRIGTVAKVSASDGAIDWLTLAPLDDDATPPTVHRPWQASAPVLVEAGLVVLDDWTDVVRVYDPVNGVIRDTFPASDWSNPLHLMKLGDDVLAIGSSVIRLDGITLEPRWTYHTHGTVRGRAGVTADRLYLPLDDRVQIVDLDDGTPAGTYDISPPVNLMAMEGQLIAYQRDGLSSYSSWEIAAAQLERRMAANSSDARPVMAMAWLAFRTERTDALLAALDRAVDLVRAEGAADDLSDRLFEQIMKMAADREATTPELRQQLFDRASAVTTTPDQQVAYRLALAEAYEQLGRYPEAVEQYQTILSEPTYRRRLFHHETGSRQAALEAQRRLAAILEKQGAHLYEPYEAFARRRLAELTDQADPAPLVELADAYPLASVTVQALSMAAERTADQQRVREAVAMLRRAAQLTQDTDQLAKLFGRQAELFEQSGQPHRARRVLRALVSSTPDLRPIRNGQPVDAEAWIDQLSEHMETRGSANRVDLPLSAAPVPLEGRLLQPTNQDADAPNPETFVLAMPGRIEMYRAADEKKLWEVNLEWQGVHLLAGDAQRLWLASADGTEIRMLDAKTGKVNWKNAEVRQQLAAIQAPATDRPRNEAEAEFRQLLPGGQIVLNRARMEQRGVAGPLVAMSDIALAVADPLGRVIVYGADSGKVSWQAATVVRSATHLMLDGQYLIIAGTDEDDAPVVCVYDAQSGMLLHRLANPKRQNVVWMGLSDQRQLIYVSGTQIEAFDLDRGQSTWICKPGAKMVGGEDVWMNGDRLMVRTEDNDLITIDLADGQVTHRLPLRGVMEGAVTVMSEADRWYVAGTNRCMGLDRDGKLLWQDAIADATQFVGMHVTDRYVLLLSAPDGQMANALTRRLYAIDRQVGRLEHVTKLVPAEHLDTMHAIDGHLLIGGAGMTAVFSGAP